MSFSWPPIKLNEKKPPYFCLLKSYISSLSPIGRLISDIIMLLRGLSLRGEK